MPKIRTYKITRNLDPHLQHTYDLTTRYQPVLLGGVQTTYNLNEPLKESIILEETRLHTTNGWKTTYCEAPTGYRYHVLIIEAQTSTGNRTFDKIAYYDRDNTLWIEARPISAGQTNALIVNPQPHILSNEPNSCNEIAVNLDAGNTDTNLSVKILALKERYKWSEG